MPCMPGSIQHWLVIVLLRMYMTRLSCVIGHPCLMARVRCHITRLGVTYSTLLETKVSVRQTKPTVTKHREGPGEVFCLYAATFIVTFCMFWSPGQFSGPSCTNNLPTNATGSCSRWKPSNDGSNVHESDGNC